MEDRRRVSSPRRKEHKGAAMSDTLETLKRQVDELSHRIPYQPFPEPREKLVAVQSKWEGVARAFGDSVPEPAFLRGETTMQYRQRMAKRFKQHSPTWKDVDVSIIYGGGFDVAESQIFADAQREAKHPTNIPVGTLIERIEPDAAGRSISKFYGDPGVTWAPFKLPTRRITGWNTGRK
jgi:hypothetical protein